MFVEIAESCIQEKGVNRPSMNDVMEKLGFALELQEAANAEKDKINPGGEHCYPEVVFPWLATSMWVTRQSSVQVFVVELVL